MRGSESQTEWGQTGGSCLLLGPSLLALEMLQEMPRRAQLLCDLLSGTWGPFSNWPWESATEQGNCLLPAPPHLSARLAPSISALPTPWFYLNTTSLLPPQGLCTYSYF